MLKGLFVSKAGMLAQQRRLEVAANNLANANTLGFKRTQISFTKMLGAMLDETTDENRVPGTTTIDFSSGTLKKTGNPLDVAIQGDGFFVLQGPEGEVFTRNGNFTLNEQGELVSQNGWPVLTSQGVIQITNGEEVAINQSGEIQVNGKVVGTLRIAVFNNPETLQPLNNSLFTATNGYYRELDPSEIFVQPGHLETSNVNPLSEMIQLIDINRNFELAQKSAKAQDESLGQLFNRAGRR